MNIYLILIFTPVVLAANFIGPALIKIQRAEKCSEDGPGYKLNFSITKVNRTHQGFNVYIDSLSAFGEGTEVNITTSVWGDGGWKPHVFDIIDNNGCELMMKYMKPELTDYLRANGLPEQCPLKEGITQIKNFVFNGKIDSPVMFGEFMAEVNVKQDGQLLTCTKVFMHSSPRSPAFG